MSSSKSRLLMIRCLATIKLDGAIGDPKAALYDVYDYAKNISRKRGFQIHKIEEARYDVAFVNSLWPISWFFCVQSCLQ